MKNSTQKGFIVPVLIIIIVVLLGIVGYLTVGKTDKSSTVLTPAEARALVIETWGDCTPDMCSKVVVSTEQKNNQWYVTATYEGLKDDSTSAMRKVALATYGNNKWSLGQPTESHRCHTNRGHQDFTTESCI